MFCDGQSIQAPIRLGAGRAHRWALARVQYPELNSGTIDGMRHSAAKRVPLFDDMTLANSTYRRITRHLADGIESVCNQQCAGACAGPGQRRFGTRMPAANHEDINWSIYWHLVRKIGSIRFIVIVAGKNVPLKQIRLFVREIVPFTKHYVRV